MGGRIGPGGNHAEHLIAHIVQIIVVGEIAGPNDLDARSAQAAFGKLLGEDRRLGAGEIDKGSVGLDVADAL